MKKGKQSNGNGASKAGNGSAAAAMVPVTTNSRVVVRCANCNHPVVVEMNAKGVGRGTVDLHRVLLDGKPVLVMAASDELLLKASKEATATLKYGEEDFTTVSCPNCGIAIPVTREQKKVVRLRPSSQVVAIASSANSARL